MEVALKRVVNQIRLAILMVYDELPYDITKFWYIKLASFVMQTSRLSR